MDATLVSCPASRQMTQGEEAEEVSRFKSIRGSRTSAKLSGSRLRIVVLTQGTRGDVQPFIALSTHLQASGFNVLVFTNSNHVGFLEKFGVNAKGVAPDASEGLQHPKMKEFMRTGDMRYFKEYTNETKQPRRKSFAKTVDDQYEAIRKFSPQLILATPLELVNGAVFGRMFEVPVINCNLFTMKPSKYVTTFLNEPCFSYYAWWLVHKKLYDRFMEEKMPIFQEKFGAQLAGCPVWPSFQAYMHEVMNPIAPELLGFSPSLMARPKDWPRSLDPVHITGFWVVGEEEQRSGRSSKFGGKNIGALEAFLAEGEAPPAYIGWGSMIAGSGESMALLAVRSLRLAKVRGIILGGWAKLSAEMVRGAPDANELEAYIASSVLFLESAPHEWLFPRCSVTVHHGGAGTLATAIRSGVPTIITPCFFDQYANGNLVAESGVGLKMQQLSKVTPQQLSEAITRCTTDTSMRENARQMGDALQQEDGLDAATAIIDQFTTGELAAGTWRKKFDALRGRGQMKSGGTLGGLCCAPCTADSDVETLPAGAGADTAPADTPGARAPKRAPLRARPLA